MLSSNQLSREEQRVVHRVDEYFKSPSMTLQEKVINALLIAQHELEEHNFSTESERMRITQFKITLDSLLSKPCFKEQSTSSSSIFSAFQY